MNLNPFFEYVAASHNADGGGTFQIEGGGLGGKPLSSGTPGFIVSVAPKRNLRITGPKIDVPTIARFVRANYDLLHTPGHYLGTWLDAETGTTHLDVVALVADRKTALELARKNGEKAIWDLQTKCVITVREEVLTFILRRGGPSSYVLSGDGTDIHRVRQVRRVLCTNFIKRYLNRLDAPESIKVGVSKDFFLGSTRATFFTPSKIQVLGERFPTYPDAWFVLRENGIVDSFNQSFFLQIYEY